MRAADTQASPNRAAAEHPEWTVLLEKAVNTPGVLSDAYRRFWNYSVGNQLLALFQCHGRGIEPGPIYTFIGWKELGRSVKKGEKALTLCMPVTVRHKRDGPTPENEEKRDASNEGVCERSVEETEASVPARTRFVYRPHWFVLSQTEGREYLPAELPQWSQARALIELKIEQIRFCHTDGNMQGYAVNRQVAVSPIAFMPARTLLHELAHVVLGHTEELQRLDDDDSATPRDLREVEAECVALICCSSLDLGGEAFSRGYVQHWLNGQSIPERSAQKAFKAADQILRAGRATPDCTDPS